MDKLFDKILGWNCLGLGLYAGMYAVDTMHFVIPAFFLHSV